MRKPLFTGVCTALVTPFLNGKVNYPMMEQLLKRQIEAGIKAVVIAGTTGESATLSDQEKITLFRRCKEYVGNQCMIIAGTGSNSTAHTVQLSAAAQECGDGAVNGSNRKRWRPIPEDLSWGRSGILSQYQLFGRP